MHREMLAISGGSAGRLRQQFFPKLYPTPQIVGRRKLRQHAQGNVSRLDQRVRAGVERRADTTVCRRSDRFWSQLIRYACEEPYAVHNGALALAADPMAAEPQELIRVRAHKHEDGC